MPSALPTDMSRDDTARDTAEDTADDTADDTVFKALADVTRRALLDALFERDGQSVQALCEQFPSMTRFGVMKHLKLLEAANLVTTRREGRSKRHFLNPIPIQQLADRWIDKYAQPFARSMVDLQTELEHRTA